MLHIKNLTVAVDDKEIIKGLNLHIKPGEIHAVMGPNGAGKSTLAKVCAGDPAYEVTSGEIIFDGNEILELDPEERARSGLFVGFQYPPEIPGVSNFQFLFAADTAKRKANNAAPLSEEVFRKLLGEKLELLEMNSAFLERGLNEGFSGGEKKRNEILQMAVLDPSVSILDETDSGLDIDAMRIVACGVKRLFNEGKGLLLITHYQRLLDYIRPHIVHVMVDGQIVKSGGPELAKELEENGYEAFA